MTIFRLVDNDQIADFNAWLENLALENNLAYIDVNQALAQDNKLKFDLTSDGLHFTEKGQQIYFDMIKKLIIKEN